MSLATICGVTVLRSLVISMIGVFLSRHLSQRIDTGYSKRSFTLFLLILSPFLVPELIVGYAWSLISLKLVHYPFFIELIYASLVLLKVVPVGIVCFHFSAPPVISPEADFIQKSMRATSASISGMKSRWSFLLWKTMQRTIPVWTLLFLLSFQEFEMASLIYRDSWTVWIFDAQAGGVPITQTISFLTGPLIIELLIISGVLFLFSRLPHPPRLNPPSNVKKQSLIASVLSWSYLLIAFFAVVVIPFSLTGWGGVLSLGSLFQNQLQLAGILSECAWGLLYGITAGIAAWGLASFFFSKNQSRILKVTGFLCCLPGLCGSLTLALIMATLFLAEYSRWLYDTPLALFIALVFYLFPRAVFLKLIFIAQWQNDSLFLAQLLSQSKNHHQAIKGGRLRWAVYGNMQYWAVVILAFWSYWDVIISSILAPNHTMSSAVRLYGLMHYGQNSILSAMTFLSLFIPVFVSILLLPVVKYLWITVSDRFNMNQTV
ncbi:hypothetical protein [uncultured Gimesia sp.]|jgi:hypothetical protein|uniref:hypothetical protein n=1 Tax=uncultured Gimesia sp. TaxID=1678688 RepID=UPI0026130B0C|nr:hypothetical protein [uncultured Gimesia sp.]